MKVKIIADGLGLTKDMVYDVIKIVPTNTFKDGKLISLKNDAGEIDVFNYPSSYIFMDVTIEYRSELIDEILK